MTNPILTFGTLSLIGFLAVMAVVFEVSAPSVSDLCIPYTGVEDSGDGFSGFIGGCE